MGAFRRGGAAKRRGSAAAAAALTVAEDADGDDDEAPALLRSVVADSRALRARFGSAVERRPPRALAARRRRSWRQRDFKCRSVGQTTSSSISQQAAARTRQSRYGSMSRQSSSRRSIANLVNGSPRRSSSTLANGAAEGEMIDPDQLV